MQFFLIRTRCKYELQHGVCCCRLPDEEAGEVPASCVVRRRGAEESEADLMAYVASRVASYKRLRTLHLVDAIPKSVSGKILRRQLRDHFINITKQAA
jgi:4-coumarate--CoA ligase